MEQNTNRMWWTIGAVLLGGILISGFLFIISNNFTPKISEKMNALIKTTEPENKINPDDAAVTHTAYAWSEDGTDRFTTTKPNLNLLYNTTFKNHEPLPQQYFSMAIKNGGVNNKPYISVSYNNPTENSYTDTIQWGNWGSWGFDTESLKPSTTYTFSFYLKGKGHIITHVYPDLIDNSTDNGLVDGEVITPSPDGYYKWNLTSEWVRHTYTFTTKSSIQDGVDPKNFLFRLFTGNSVDIGLPKVEKGSTATPYMPSASEVKPSDQPKYIGTYTDKSKTDSQDPKKYTWKLNPDYHE